MRGKLTLERIGVLIVVGLLLAGCAPALGRTARPAPPAGIPSSYRQTAEEMAAQWGVPADEAYQRLRVEDAIGTLQTELAVWEVDTFAGLWIEHEPGYAVVVAFTRDGEKTLKPYLEGRSIPGLTVRKARYTLAEFVENAHTEAILKEIGVHWAQGYYYGKPTVIHPQGITIAPGCEWSKDGTSDNSGTG